jgi:hypothetical protein
VNFLDTGFFFAYVSADDEDHPASEKASGGQDGPQCEALGGLVDLARSWHRMGGVRASGPSPTAAGSGREVKCALLGGRA